MKRLTILFLAIALTGCGLTVPTDNTKVYNISWDRGFSAVIRGTPQPVTGGYVTFTDFMTGETFTIKADNIMLRENHRPPEFWVAYKNLETERQAVRNPTYRQTLEFQRRLSQLSDQFK